MKGKPIYVRIIRESKQTPIRNLEDIPLAAGEMEPWTKEKGIGSNKEPSRPKEPVTLILEIPPEDKEYEAAQKSFDTFIATLTPRVKQELRTTISKRICPATPSMAGLIDLFRKWSAASKGQLVKDK